MTAVLNSLILVATSFAWLSASAAVPEGGHDLAFELPDEPAPHTRGLSCLGEERVSEGFEDDCDFSGDSGIAGGREILVGFAPAGDACAEDRGEFPPASKGACTRSARGPPSC